MKKLIFLLLITTLCSCFNDTDQNIFVVERVTISEQGHCAYQIQGTNVAQFNLNGACGLFQPGDTLTLVKK